MALQWLPFLVTLVACSGEQLGLPLYPQPTLIPVSRPDASSTCGLSGPETVCVANQAAMGSLGRECGKCDASQPALAHPPALAVDGDPDTYWQSETYDALASGPVALSLPLSRRLELLEVQLEFLAPAPESFAILKSSSQGGLAPLHFYSNSCNQTYGLAQDGFAGSGAPAAVCSSVPVGREGGLVRLGLLGPQPSPELRDWATADRLTVRLDRPSISDEDIGILEGASASGSGSGVGREEEVRASYYYAVAEVRVEGRCACNGHASSCSLRANGTLSCDCQHSTGGEDCQRCQPLYRDSPWAPATQLSPYACKLCQCNNQSLECRFDEARFASSGGVSGGVCVGCQHNTTGADCGTCALGHHLSSLSTCTACPHCYGRLLHEFSLTLQRLSQLLSLANKSLGLDPELVVRIEGYKSLLEGLLLRAINSTASEAHLLEQVNATVASAEELVRAVGAKVNQTQASVYALSLSSILASGELAVLDRLASNVTGKLSDLQTRVGHLQDLLDRIEQEYTELMALALEAKNRSLEQDELVRALVEQLWEAVGEARGAVELLCAVVEQENKTSLLLASLGGRLQAQPSPGELALGLQALASSVSGVLGESRRLWEQVEGGGGAGYNSSALLAVLGGWVQRLAAAMDEADRLLNRTEGEVQPAFDGLSSAALEVFNFSADLHNMAVTLLSAADGARLLASTLYEDTSVLHNTTLVVLDGLLTQLELLRRFKSQLDSVLRTLGLAERQALAAEEQVVEAVQVGRQAVLLVGRALELTEQATTQLEQAASFAAEANSSATEALSGALELNTTASELGLAVGSASLRTGALEERAREEGEAIGEAAVTAGMALDTASGLQGRLEASQVRLSQVQRALNSTVPLEQAYLQRINSTVAQLQAGAEENQLALLQVQEDVLLLEASSQLLREKYTELRQQRDLLRVILERLEALDCVDQFI